MSLVGTHLKLAKISIKENRTRSFLTCLGIAIGVASIILILSLTGSVSRLVADQVETIGDELIIVRPNYKKDTVSGIVDELMTTNTYQSSSLTTEDIKVIQETDGVEEVAPLATSIMTAVADQNQIDSMSFYGTNEDFDDIYNLSLRYGTFLTDDMNDNMAVVGHSTALKLFNTQNPVGKIMTVKGERLVVVGVLSEMDGETNFNNIDYDNSIFVKTEMLEEINGSVQIQQISVKAQNIESLGEVSQSIQERLLEKKAGDNNFEVVYGDEIVYPASNLLNTVSGILMMIAGISLLVGGIGVMNIMLVAVAERTQEIGIRKAVGASFKNILMQFLFESLILSLMGGLMGLVLGYVLAFLISVITPFTPFISWQILLVTLVTSVVVGVIFGIYPALKAASRNPIESLKHYR